LGDSWEWIAGDYKGGDYAGERNTGEDCGDRYAHGKAVAGAAVNEVKRLSHGD
jgi:hypothetical protein